MLGRPWLAPFFQIDGAGLAVGADLRGVAQLVQLAGDQAGAELDAEAGRVELALVDAAVVQGQLGRGHGQLNGPGHHLQALAVFLLDDNSWRRSRGSRRRCEPAGRTASNERMGRMPLRPASERLPERGHVQADGADDADAGDHRPAG